MMDGREINRRAQYTTFSPRLLTFKKEFTTVLNLISFSSTKKALWYDEKTSYTFIMNQMYLNRAVKEMGIYAEDGVVKLEGRWSFVRTGNFWGIRLVEDLHA